MGRNLGCMCTPESSDLEPYTTAREDLARIIAQETCGIKGVTPEDPDFKLAEKFIEMINQGDPYG